jgi:hypothetical protein
MPRKKKQPVTTPAIDLPKDFLANRWGQTGSVRIFVCAAV